MKTICVLQHTEAEYLGLMEDHFEGRNIRFHYVRPFTPGGQIPTEAGDYNGLIILGGGPYGTVSGDLLPSLLPEMKLIKDFLAKRLPVVGIGLGANLLCVAAGGGVEEAPLRFELATALRGDAAALNGFLPERFPLACYLRDRPVLPVGAHVLASDESGVPLIFALSDAVFGFVGHPGAKSGMLEDLIMEFAETPPDTARTLEAVRQAQAEIADALSRLMVGLNQKTGWM